MAVRNALVLVGTEVSELPVGDTLAGLELSTVASFASLPASITGAAIYVVTTDETNNNETTLYALIGAAKLWIPANPV